MSALTARRSLHPRSCHPTLPVVLFQNSVRDIKAVNKYVKNLHIYIAMPDDKTKPEVNLKKPPLYQKTHHKGVIIQEIRMEGKTECSVSNFC